MPPTLSLTESQQFQAIGAFVESLLPATVEVVRAEGNLVGEPKGNDFVIMTQMRMERLGTNEVTFQDNSFTGSIAGTVLTVSAILPTKAQTSPLAAGMILRDTAGNVTTGTLLGLQLSGTPGGVGTYSVSPSQNVASDTLYAGVRSDAVQTQWVVQLNVHGPSSADNARIIEGLFRSDYGATAIAASGFDVTPLYCESPKQSPFEDAEQQTEFDWMIEAHLQVNPIIGTPQQFAEVITPTTVESDR
jgi:hypothetical protein